MPSAGAQRGHQDPVDETRNVGSDVPTLAGPKIPIQQEPGIKQTAGRFGKGRCSAGAGGDGDDGVAGTGLVAVLVHDVDVESMWPFRIAERPCEFVGRHAPTTFHAFS